MHRNNIFAPFMKPIAEALPLLQGTKRIAIITHYKPDGDAIGSTLALSHFLRLRGHEVAAITPNDAPEFLSFLPGTEWLINAEAEPERAAEELQQANFIFCLDFNDPARVQGMQQALESSKATKLLIDHHMFPKPAFDYGESNSAKSSTCEMVYDFINTCGGNALINLDIAKCLYTGTLTDTGSFRFPITTGAVHRMIADLIDRGMEHSLIHEAIYDSWSINRMRFVGYALIERMEIFPQWQAGLISVTRADMKLFDLQPGDTEGLVQYPLSIRGIRFSTLITERADEVRLSFRSKGDFDVNLFARTHFSGGGHFNASGGKSSESINDTIIRFKKILSEFHPL